MTCHKHHPINATISSQAELDDLAAELADDYIQYFDIDIKNEQRRHGEAVEECLAHLEEVFSALDSYKQKDDIVDQFVQTIATKKEPLDKLNEQVDSLEQYVFETNRILDQLELSIKELEKHSPSYTTSKIKQIFGMLPKSLPRFGLFSGLGEIIDDPILGHQQGGAPSESNNQQSIPISDIIDRISRIEIEMDQVTSNLYSRLGKGSEEANKKTQNDSLPPIAALSLDSTTENVDNSWQELL